MKTKSSYPKPSECLALFDEYRMPDNVRAHTMQVARVAVFIAERLKKKGIAIDVGLVRSASMLHDLARAAGFSDDGFWKGQKELYHEADHKHLAAKILSRYPELALIIRKHGYSSILDDPPRTWEEKVVNYADKRVAHDKIVSLDERFLEGRARWLKREKPLDSKREAKIQEMHHEIERDIFMIIGISPAQLEEGLSHA